MPAVILPALKPSQGSSSPRTSRTSSSGKLPYCGPLGAARPIASQVLARRRRPGRGVRRLPLVDLFVFAFVWWRTNATWALAAHYGLSLVGVIFEVYFTFLELFVIHAVCVWCALYGISLVARFLVTLWVWMRRPKGEGATA
jgi:hypothetical protein